MIEINSCDAALSRTESNLPFQVESSEAGAVALLARAIRLLCEIHRHDDYISICQGPNCAQVAALRPHELGGMFPSIAAQLIADSYYSINGMRGPWRNAKLVSHFTCVFVDVDLHDDWTPIKIEAAMAVLFAAATERAIPPPSMIARSGRGFWAFWLLREAGSDRAVARTSDVYALWIRLQRALREKLNSAGLAVDGAANDPARLTRIPGSLNTKAAATVAYTITADADGRPIWYTLSKLAAALAVPLDHPVPTPPTATIRLVPPADGGAANSARSAKAERAATGWRALRNRRLRDFEVLLELRGGRFREGHRHHAALILATLLRGSQEQGNRVRDLCRCSCNPPLPASEIADVLKQANRRHAYRFRDQRIGEWLGVTSEENELLAGEYLETRQKPEVGRREIAKQRRELISQLCAGRRRVPPLREIALLLRGRDIKVSPETIRSDLKAINLRNPRATQGLGAANLFLIPDLDLTPPQSRETLHMLVSGQGFSAAENGHSATQS